jgi:hypothetical protein
MKKNPVRTALARIAVASGILALLARSPWLTAGTTAWLARAQFNAAWSFVMDGCGARLPATRSPLERTPFGAWIVLEYRCGLVAPGQPYQQARVFVSFLGTAHGYPSPWHSNWRSQSATPIPAIRVTP